MVALCLSWGPLVSIFSIFSNFSNLASVLELITFGNCACKELEILIICLCVVFIFFFCRWNHGSRPGAVFCGSLQARELFDFFVGLRALLLNLHLPVLYHRL